MTCDIQEVEIKPFNHLAIAMLVLIAASVLIEALRKAEDVD
jgi:phosphopantetheine adenylyltransferase